jgi:hypothetical protein
MAVEYDYNDETSDICSIVMRDTCQVKYIIQSSGADGDKLRDNSRFEYR